MGKFGGIILLSALALSECAAASAAAPGGPDPADPSTYNSSYSADEFFIAGVKLGWVGELPTNTELVRAGMAACQHASTASDGNSQLIRDYAAAVYC